MKLKPYLKNLIKLALSTSLLIVIVAFCGCTSSTNPTYLKGDIANAIKDILKNEYKIDVTAKLIEQTLWIYLPLQDIFIKSDKPEKYSEEFAIDYNKDEFAQGAFQIKYLIKPLIPKLEKTQDFKYNKDVSDKVNNLWKVIRRVLFSMDRSKRSEPHFFCLVSADIKNGFLIKETFYYMDIKKVSYDYISWTEYQHRTIEDIEISPKIIGDKEGKFLDYKNITLEEFLAGQIQHRIKLKFQKAEVSKSADIDKEVIKIAVTTLKAYDFKDFSTIELSNMATNNKIILNQAAVWARATSEQPRF